MGLTFKKEEARERGDLIEDGTVLDALVKDVKKKHIKPRGGGEEFDKAEWKFEVVAAQGDELDGRPFWGNTGVEFVEAEGCKLTNWTEAVLARILPIEYEVDMDDVLDKPCRIEIGVREYTKTVDGVEVENQVNYVRDVFPTKSKMAEMAAQRDEAARASARAAVQADEEPF